MTHLLSRSLLGSSLLDRCLLGSRSGLLNGSRSGLLDGRSGFLSSSLVRGKYVNNDPSAQERNLSRYLDGSFLSGRSNLLRDSLGGSSGLLGSRLFSREKCQFERIEEII